MGIYTYIFTPELQAQDYMSGFVERRSNACCHSQPAGDPSPPFHSYPPLMPVHLCKGKSIIGTKPVTVAILFEPASVVVLSHYLFCFRTSVLLATGIRCLTHNERHNQPIQCQGLGENEHNEHTDKQFVLVAHDDGGIGHTGGGTSVLAFAVFLAAASGHRSEHSGHVALGPEAGGDDAGLADHADSPAGGQAGQPAREPGSDVSPAVVLGVGVAAHVVVGLGDPPGDDDGHDEAVDAEDAGHDDGDEVLDHSPRVVHSHLTEAEAGLPCSPRRAEVGQNAAHGRPEEAEEGGPGRAVLVPRRYFCKRHAVLII